MDPAVWVHICSGPAKSNRGLTPFLPPITINRGTGHILVHSYASTDAEKHNELQRQALFLYCAGCLLCLLILREYRRPFQGKYAREKVIR